MWKSGGDFWSTLSSFDRNSRPDAELISAVGQAKRHVAILDSDAVILEVNDAWREFARFNGWKAPDYGVGQYYLAVCARADDDPTANRAAIIIRALIAGQIEQSSFIYSCGGASQKRSFVFEAYRFNPDYIIVCHIHLRQLGRLGIV